jgi:hypothetical protein
MTSHRTNFRHPFPFKLSIRGVRLVPGLAMLCRPMARARTPQIMARVLRQIVCHRGFSVDHFAALTKALCAVVRWARLGHCLGDLDIVGNLILKGKLDILPRSTSGIGAWRRHPPSLPRVALYPKRLSREECGQALRAGLAGEHGRRRLLAGGTRIRDLEADIVGHLGSVIRAPLKGPHAVKSTCARLDMTTIAIIGNATSREAAGS